MVSTIEDLKAKVNQEIDRRGESLIAATRHILKNPESGFKETKTSNTVQGWFRELGIEYTDNLAITGLRGVVHGKAGDGPTIAVIGELDSMVVPGHSEEDHVTHAAHACGHHIQIGNMLGVAAGLLAPGVLDKLSGRIVFMAVPAEEYIELEFRNDLRRQGKIEFLTGKGEFIRLGAFDDVDLAVMTHAGSRDSDQDEPTRDLMIGSGNNGLVAKRAEFIGRASHAGGAPWRGVNALNAATLAIQAIHMQRETFKDEDSIRVHPIITKGGSAVNAVPDAVHIETYVRGRTLDAILEANAKVDRALRAGAMAIGAQVRILNLGEMLPLINDPDMVALYKAGAEKLVGTVNVGERGHGGGSTDMGDVSHLMPALHPFVNAATGQGHGIDYLVQDYPLAVLTAAKAMANMVVDLLSEGGKVGRQIVEKHRPLLTKQEYIKLTRGLYGEELFPAEKRSRSRR